MSTLNFVSKVFEKTMYVRLSNYCHRFNLISLSQFGFRKKKSTTDAVLQFVELAYSALNSKKYFMSILLDFSKAFDTVNHSILIDKLDMMGIRGVYLDWFRS